MPSNLKVYYNQEIVDLHNFKIEGNKNNLYNFTWKWDYEANNDEIDTNDSKLGNISFDIVLNISNMDTKVPILPKTGDF